MTDWNAAADPARRIGHAVEAHAEIGSTNDRARLALDEPRGEGRAILAELQVAGRGRRGRTWQSPAGLNLTISVAVRPRLRAAAAGLLGAAAALAVRTACLPHAELAIKWPNDLVDADGRKVAGLLLETALVEECVAHAVIGVGINVNWRREAMPTEVAATAVSLADLARHEVDRVALLGRLLGALDEEVTALERHESPIDRYRAAAWLDGRTVVVSLGDTEVEGVVLGMNDQGSLMLETDGGRLSLTIGEVVHVRQTAAVVV